MVYKTDMIHSIDIIDYIYIRNAIKDAKDWNNTNKICEEIKDLSRLLSEYMSLIIIPFGKRTFEL